MGTFLVTPRMNPALRARVERAVSHRTRARHHAARLGLSGTFASREALRPARLVPLAVALLVAGLAALAVVHDRHTLEAERTALLATLAFRRATMPPGHEGLVAATEQWIAEATAAPGGADLVDPSLRGQGALDAALRRPALYVHAPATELHDAKGIDEAARASDKDAFLVCLLRPPASGTEKDLLAKVRGVYFGGAKVDEETASVRRLAEARLGLAVLGPAFTGAVQAAPDMPALKRLRRELEAAPVDQARRAAAAELLLVVGDGPATPGAPTREARVTLIDLAAKRVLLRLNRHPEEQGKSASATLHRDDLEGCSLALAVRRGVEG